MLKAGLYWVGDPCYVLDDANGYNWQEVLTKTRFFNLFATDEDMRNSQYTSKVNQCGEFDWGKGRMCASSTMYGDGVYFDLSGREYGVDAGLLSAIPLDMLPDTSAKMNRAPTGVSEIDGGHIIEFKEDFTIEFTEDGKILIGHIFINTGDSDDEDEYYEDDEDYEY